MRRRRWGRAPDELPRRVRGVIEAVARDHGVPFDVLMSSKTRGHVLAARDAAIYRVRHDESRSGKAPSLPQIGRWFGKDHSTIHSAIARHEARHIRCVGAVDNAFAPLRLTEKQQTIAP